MASPDQIQAAIAALRSGSGSDVAPVSSELARLASEAAARQERIRQADLLRTDMAQLRSELEPYRSDVKAREDRNAALRSKVDALRARGSP